MKRKSLKLSIVALTCLSTFAFGATVPITGNDNGGYLLIDSDKSDDNASGYYYTDTTNAIGGKVEIVDGGIINIATGGYSKNANAINNTAIINGGTFHSITGGISFDGNAINNTVIIKGGTFDSEGKLYGGLTGNSGTSSGNALHLHKKLDIREINQFQKLYFHLSKDMKNGDTMLKVKRVVNMESLEDVSVTSKSTTIKKGDKITLIKATDDFELDRVLSFNKKTVSALEGYSFINYDFLLGVNASDKTLTATVTGNKTVSKTTKSLTSTQAISLTNISSGLNHISNQGISSALIALSPNNKIKPTYFASSSAIQSDGRYDYFKNNTTWQAFTSVNVGNTKYDINPEIKTNNVSMILGMARKATDSIALGLFYEHGSNSFDTTQTFPTSTIKGNGNGDYNGLGLLGRFDINPNIYINASLSVGKSKYDYETIDSYESSSTYINTHLKAGYNYKIKDNLNLDTSLAFLYSHLNSDDVTTDNGVKLSFDSINSQILKPSIYLNYKHDNLSSLFLGTSLEQEFSSKANGLIEGLPMQTSSLKGTTYLFEAGTHLKPSQSKEFYVDLGLQAFGGKRDGYNTHLGFSYKF